MAFIHYQTTGPGWGTSQFQFGAPPTPAFRPQSMWGGWDYFRAHAVNPDQGTFQRILNHVQDFAHSGGVGHHEARKWHRRIYGGLVNLTQVLPADIGAAAAYEAYRMWQNHAVLYEPLAGRREREREGLIGLASAEASHLWQFAGRQMDVTGYRDALETAALTASRLAYRLFGHSSQGNGLANATPAVYARDYGIDELGRPLGGAGPLYPPPTMISAAGSSSLSPSPAVYAGAGSSAGAMPIPSVGGGTMPISAANVPGAYGGGSLPTSRSFGSQAGGPASRYDGIAYPDEYGGTLPPVGYNMPYGGAQMAYGGTGMTPAQMGMYGAPAAQTAYASSGTGIMPVQTGTYGSPGMQGYPYGGSNTGMGVGGMPLPLSNGAAIGGMPLPGVGHQAAYSSMNIGHPGQTMAVPPGSTVIVQRSSTRHHDSGGRSGSRSRHGHHHHHHRSRARSVEPVHTQRTTYYPSGNGNAYPSGYGATYPSLPSYRYAY